MPRGMSKYAPEDYAEMRRLYHVEKWSQARIARRYNMSEVQIGRIVRGVSQRDAPGADDVQSQRTISEAEIAESQAKVLKLLERKEEVELPEALRPKIPNPYGA